MAFVSGTKASDNNATSHQNNTCESCQATIAEHYIILCERCGQSLCEDCNDLHGYCRRAGRTGLQANLPDINTRHVRDPEARNHSSSDDVICSDYGNGVAVEYCEIHKAAVCDTCKASKHGACTTASIEETINNFGREKLNTLNNSIDSLNEDIRRLKENRVADLYTLDELREQYTEEVKVTRKKIQDNLERLEADHLTDVDAFVQQRRESIENHITALETEYQRLEQEKRSVKRIKRGGRKSEMLTNASKAIKSHKDVSENVNNEATRPGLTFVRSIQINDIKPELNKFGFLRKDDKTFLGMKVKSSRSVNVRTTEEIFPTVEILRIPAWLVPLEDQSSPPIIPITGCTFMPTGDLFVCYGKTGAVRLLNASLIFTYMSEKISLAHGVHDATVIDENTVIVSLTDGKC